VTTLAFSESAKLEEAVMTRETVFTGGGGHGLGFGFDGDLAGVGFDAVDAEVAMA